MSRVSESQRHALYALPGVPCPQHDKKYGNIKQFSGQGWFKVQTNYCNQIIILHHWTQVWRTTITLLRGTTSLVIYMT